VIQSGTTCDFFSGGGLHHIHHIHQRCGVSVPFFPLDFQPFPPNPTPPPFILVWVLFQSTNGSLLPYWWLFSRLIRVKVLHACVVFLIDVDLHLFHPYQRDYMLSLRIFLSCSVGYQCAVNIFQSPSVFYLSKCVRFNCSWLTVFQFSLSFSIRNSIFLLAQNSKNFQTVLSVLFPIWKPKQKKIL